MTKKTISMLILAAGAALVGACETAPQQGASSTGKFDTPPNWLDRVSVVAYTPPRDVDSPPPLGNYEKDDPTRWMFRGHPLHWSDDDQAFEEVPAGEEAMDEGGGGEE